MWQLAHLSSHTTENIIFVFLPVKRLLCHSLTSLALWGQVGQCIVGLRKLVVKGFVMGECVSDSTGKVVESIGGVGVFWRKG